MLDKGAVYPEGAVDEVDRPDVAGRNHNLRRTYTAAQVSEPMTANGTLPTGSGVGRKVLVVECCELAVGDEKAWSLGCIHLRSTCRH